MTVDTESPFYMDGIVIDESVHNMRFPTGMTYGLRFGGMGRNIDIADSQIVIGDGSGWFHAYNEFDLDATVSLINNKIDFLVAPGVKGTWISYGIGLTEGTSNVRIASNKFSNGQLRSENGDNSLSIIGNTFINSSLAMGCLTANGCNVGSFGPPNGWVVSGNNFSGRFPAPNDGVVLEFKNVGQRQEISGNNIVVSAGSSIKSCIRFSSGITSHNSCYTNANANFPTGIEITPQLPGAESVPTYPISAIGNLICAANKGNGINVDDPGGSWTGVINLSGNTSFITAGTGDAVASISHTPNIRIMNEHIGVGGGVIYKPSSLGKNRGGLTTNGGSTIADAFRKDNRCSFAKAM